MKTTKNDDHNFTIYNCHTHCFNLDHVNNRFLKGTIPLITIPLNVLKPRFIRGLAYKLSYIIPGHFDNFDRAVNYIRHSFDIETSKAKSQETIIRRLQSYYPKNTKFAILTMDMGAIQGATTLPGRARSLQVLS